MSVTQRHYTIIVNEIKFIFWHHFSKNYAIIQKSRPECQDMTTLGWEFDAWLKEDN